MFELQKTLKEAVIASFDLLTQYLPGDSIRATGVPPIKPDTKQPTIYKQLQ
jgi:hypothetical protein